MHMRSCPLWASAILTTWPRPTKWELIRALQISVRERLDFLPTQNGRVLLSDMSVRLRAGEYSALTKNLLSIPAILRVAYELCWLNEADPLGAIWR